MKKKHVPHKKFTFPLLRSTNILTTKIRKIDCSRLVLARMFQSFYARTRTSWVLFLCRLRLWWVSAGDYYRSKIDRSEQVGKTEIVSHLFSVGVTAIIYHVITEQDLRRAILLGWVAALDETVMSRRKLCGQTVRPFPNRFLVLTSLHLSCKNR